MGLVVTVFLFVAYVTYWLLVRPLPPQAQQWAYFVLYVNLIIWAVVAVKELRQPFSYHGSHIRQTLQSVELVPTGIFLGAAGLLTVFAPRIGFTSAAAIATPVMMVLLGNRRVRTIASVSVGMVLFLEFVIARVFQVPLGRP